ncbi:MAG: hypothetical protein LBG95_07695 [Treponema sp.]|jgi:hypothetical protein|nr:hypothetical protein [Treponema sp.]
MAQDELQDDLELNGDPFDEENDDENNSSETGEQGVDLSAQGFPEITKRLEAAPHQFFADPNYYKVALSDEGESAKRVHAIFQKYINAKDPKDRSVFRAQLITAYWEFLRSVARRASGKMPMPKKFLLRFNLLHHNFISAEMRGFFARLITENTYNQPIYYVDEWLKAVGTGVVRASTTDEVKIARNNTQMKMRQLFEKAMGKLDGFQALLKAKDQERDSLEQGLKGCIETITDHFLFGDFEDINAGYTEPQKRTIVEMQEILKNMLRCDREFASLAKEYGQAQADVQTLQDKVDGGEGEETVDFQAIDNEFDTIRQASKMTVGRQGNHFPVLTGEYYHCGPNDLGFRENIISLFSRIESIDPEAFCRNYKNRINRIVPYTLLIPTYGDTGICWEPFDKHNRATSRGRVVIPMYPKNLYIAVLSAVADLRWQVAKEKASYYWMEEGLTGNYYQWFQAQKLKGDVKDFFIQDYILWMTKEAEGVQKLDKEIRGTFWRFMPFSKEVKEKLKGRSYVYQELYQRDLNRAMSDGY